MPADPAISKEMLLSTDYPIDKIVGIYSGSYVVPNGSSNAVATIPHNLPFRPLPGGNWSNNSDFSVQNEYGAGIYPGPSVGTPFSQRTNVFTDATNIYITSSNVSGSSKTVYYRIYVFEPADSSEDIDTVRSAGDTYLLSTDFNNSKVYLDGYEDLPSTDASSDTVSVSHNLGYIPVVMGWIEGPGVDADGNVVEAVHPITSSYSFRPDVVMSTDTTDNTFTIRPFNNANRAYYRIYLDA